MLANMHPRHFQLLNFCAQHNDAIAHQTHTPTRVTLHPTTMLLLRDLQVLQTQLQTAWYSTSNFIALLHAS